MTPHLRLGILPALLFSGFALSGCSAPKPPVIAYDDPAPKPVEVVELPEPLPHRGS